MSLLNNMAISGSSLLLGLLVERMTPLSCKQCSWCPTSRVAIFPLPFTTVGQAHPNDPRPTSPSRRAQLVRACWVQLVGRTSETLKRESGWPRYVVRPLWRCSCGLVRSVTERLRFESFRHVRCVSHSVASDTFPHPFHRCRRHSRTLGRTM